MREDDVTHEKFIELPGLWYTAFSRAGNLVIAYLLSPVSKAAVIIPPFGWFNSFVINCALMYPTIRHSLSELYKLTFRLKFSMVVKNSTRCYTHAIVKMFPPTQHN